MKNELNHCCTALCTGSCCIWVGCSAPCWCHLIEIYRTKCTSWCFKQNFTLWCFKPNFGATDLKFPWTNITFLVINILFGLNGLIFNYLCLFSQRNAQTPNSFLKRALNIIYVKQHSCLIHSLMPREWSDLKSLWNIRCNLQNLSQHQAWVRVHAQSWFNIDYLRAVWE